MTFEKTSSNAKIIKAVPEYTGGGIYVIVGELDGSRWFIADTDNFDVRIIDTNAFKADWDEELFFPEWQEQHLVKDLDHSDAITLFGDIFRWIYENKPVGNYAASELNELAEKIQRKGE